DALGQDQAGDVARAEGHQDAAADEDLVGRERGYRVVVRPVNRELDGDLDEARHLFRLGPPSDPTCYFLSPASPAIFFCTISTSGGALRPACVPISSASSGLLPSTWCALSANSAPTRWPLLQWTIIGFSSPSRISASFLAFASSRPSPVFESMGMWMYFMPSSSALACSVSYSAFSPSERRLTTVLTPISLAFARCSSVT